MPHRDGTRRGEERGCVPTANKQKKRCHHGTTTTTENNVEQADDCIQRPCVLRIDTKTKGGGISRLGSIHLRAIDRANQQQTVRWRWWVAPALNSKSDQLASKEFNSFTNDEILIAPREMLLVSWSLLLEVEISIVLNIFSLGNLYSFTEW